MGKTKRDKIAERKAKIDKGEWAPPPPKKKKDKSDKPKRSNKPKVEAPVPDIPVEGEETTVLRMQEVLTVSLSIESLHPNPDNPNVEDDRQFGMLVKQIKRRGFTDPIQVTPIMDKKDARYKAPGEWSDEEVRDIRAMYGQRGWDILRQYGPEQQYEIVAGEHRWEALKVLKAKEVPAIINKHLAHNKDERDMALVANNITKGDLDPAKFTKLVQRLQPTHGMDVLVEEMGFTDSETMNMYLTEAEELLEGNEAAKKEFKKQKKNIKTIEDLGRVLNMIFTKYGSTLEYGFMHYEYGGQTHLMTYMDKPTKNMVEEIVAFCTTNKLDINKVWHVVLANGWDKTSKEQILELADQDASSDDEEDDDLFEDEGEEDDEDEEEPDDDDDDDDDEED